MRNSASLLSICIPTYNRANYICETIDSVLAQTYKDYEISIDSVKGLGDFVEIEYIGRDEKVDPKKVTEEMINFLKGLRCGKIIRNYVGYPFQLLFPEEVKFEGQ